MAHILTPSPHTGGVESRPQSQTWVQLASTSSASPEDDENTFSFSGRDAPTSISAGQYGLPHRNTGDSSQDSATREEQTATFSPPGTPTFNIDPSLELDPDAIISPKIGQVVEEAQHLDALPSQWILQSDHRGMSTPELETGLMSNSLPTRLDAFNPLPIFLGSDDNDRSEFAEDVQDIVDMPDLDGLDWTLVDPQSDYADVMSEFDPALGRGFSLSSQPQLAIDSPEMLMKRFDRLTCGIMSISDAPKENPWRRLIWPLMYSNPIVFDAVASMTCFQGSRNTPELRARGNYYSSRVLTAMQTEPESLRTDVALASALCLAFGESWDCSFSAKTGIDYIRVCKRLVKGALRTGRQNPSDVESQRRLKFLCKTWIYIDVIARLTSVDNDISNDFEHVTNLINGPLDAETDLDPLMGCASTLFPIVGRVANLARRVCRLENNTLEIVQEASRLQQSLERWTPPGEYNDPEDPTTTVIHGLQTAEAYRWATLLYLHQAVPELNSLSSAELANKTLFALANVPLTSRAVIVQIYPLLAAGCEVTTTTDREFVAQRWNSMSVRMAIGNIDRCADVVKEVWRRRDSYAAQRTAAVVPPEPPTLRPPYAPGVINLEGFPHWAEPFRQPTQSTMASRPRMLNESMRRTSSDTCRMGTKMDPEYTVRGSLHWVAVMKAFNWEGEFGSASSTWLLLTSLTQCFSADVKAHVSSTCPDYWRGRPV